MPRVKLNTPEVDSLNAVKKRVARANKAKYMGAEAAQPVVKEETQQIFNGINDRLNGIVASIGEINAQLNLTAGQNAPWASKAIDRYITATSAAKKQIADLNSYLEQNAGSLANLSEAQLSHIAGLQDELTTTFTEIVKAVNKLSPKKQQAIKKVFSVFVDDLVRLNQVLQGNIGFRETTASTTRGIPVAPFKTAAQSDPEQQVSEPERARKVRKDKGVPRKKPAGGETRDSRRRRRIILEDTSGTDADTEGGALSGGMEGDRCIGGALSGGLRNPFLERMFPKSFPAAMRKEVEGGVYLDRHDYMPTRFL
jgi:hypothetical protein